MRHYIFVFCIIIGFYSLKAQDYNMYKRTMYWQAGGFLKDSSNNIYLQIRKSEKDYFFEDEKLALGKQLFTLFSNWGSSTEINGTLLNEAEILKQDSIPLKFLLWTPLKEIKEFNRQRQGNGQSSVSSSYTQSLKWDQSNGVVLSGTDTFANFNIYSRNLQQASFPSYVKDIFNLRKGTPAWRGMQSFFEAAWVVQGKWNGKTILVFLNDETNLISWYEEESLVASFTFPSKTLRRKEPLLKAINPNDWSAYPIRDFVSDAAYYQQRKKSVTLPNKDFVLYYSDESWESNNEFMVRVSFAIWLTYVIIREV